MWFFLLCLSISLHKSVLGVSFETALGGWIGGGACLSLHLVSGRRRRRWGLEKPLCVLKQCLHILDGCFLVRKCIYVRVLWNEVILRHWSHFTHWSSKAFAYALIITHTSKHTHTQSRITSTGLFQLRRFIYTNTLLIGWADFRFYRVQLTNAISLHTWFFMHIYLFFTIPLHNYQ